MKQIFVLIFALCIQFSFGQKTNPLGAITDRYQLTLTAYYDDCGDFNDEEILLKKERNKFVVTLTVYDKSCDGNASKKSKIIKEDSFILSKEKEILFINYLEKLVQKALGEKLRGTHDGIHYYAALDFDGKKTPFRGINLHYHDINNNWDAFETLKNEIKK